MIIGIVSKAGTILGVSQLTQVAPTDAINGPELCPFSGLASTNLAYFAPFLTPEIDAMLRELIEAAKNNEGAGTELFVRDVLGLDSEKRQIHVGPYSHEIVLCGQDEM